jgi:hypothetical protein
MIRLQCSEFELNHKTVKNGSAPISSDVSLLKSEQKLKM